MTVKAPAKKTAPAAVASPPAEVNPLEALLLDLEPPKEITKEKTLPDPDKTPDALKARVEAAYKLTVERGAKTPWTFQATRDAAAAKLIETSMRNYAEGRRAGRLTFVAKDAAGGFKYKVRAFTPRA